MRVRTIYLLVLFCALAINIFAQKYSICEGFWNVAMDSLNVQELGREPNYIYVIRQLNAYKACNPDKSKKADDKIIEVNKSILQLRDRAVAEKKRADLATLKAVKEAKRATSLYWASESYKLPPREALLLLKKSVDYAPSESSIKLSLINYFNNSYIKNPFIVLKSLSNTNDSPVIKGNYLSYKQKDTNFLKIIDLTTRNVPNFLSNENQIINFDFNENNNLFGIILNNGLIKVWKRGNTFEISTIYALKDCKDLKIFNDSLIVVKNIQFNDILINTNNPINHSPLLDEVNKFYGIRLFDNIIYVITKNINSSHYKIWNFSTGKELKPHNKNSYISQYDLESNSFIFNSTDSIYFSNLADKKNYGIKFDHNSSIHSPKFSKSGNFIAIAEDSLIRIIDRQKKLNYNIKYKDRVFDNFYFNNDYTLNLIVKINSNYSSLGWDLNQRRYLNEDQNSHYFASKNENYGVILKNQIVLNYDQNIKKVEFANNICGISQVTKNWVVGIDCFDLSNRLIYLGNILKLPPFTKWINAIISEDEKYLVTEDYLSGEYDVWDLDALEIELENTVAVDEQRIDSIFVSTDRKWLVTSNSMIPSNCKLYSMETFQLPDSLKNNKWITQIIFSSNLKQLIISNFEIGNAHIKLWDVENWKSVNLFDTDSTNEVSDAYFSHDDKYILGENKNIDSDLLFVYDIERGVYSDERPLKKGNVGLNNIIKQVNHEIKLRNGVEFKIIYKEKKLEIYKSGSNKIFADHWFNASIQSSFISNDDLYVVFGYKVIRLKLNNEGQYFHSDFKESNYTYNEITEFFKSMISSYSFTQENILKYGIK